MKKFNKIISALLFGFSVLLSSCGNEEENCDIERVREASLQIEEVYLDTNASCSDYKKALNNYLDAISSCPQTSDIEIEEIRDEISNLGC